MNYQELKTSRSLGRPLLVIAGVIFAGLIVLIMTAAISRTERAECIQWQAQAAQYPAYYSTAWQIEQCAAHDIIIK